MNEDIPRGPQPPTSFEDAIRRLSEIVKRLEDGELPLEESLKAFERGIALARDAQRRLDAAEARVDELLGVDDQGRAITRPITPPASNAAARADGGPGEALMPKPRSPDVHRQSPTPAPQRRPPGRDDDDLPF